MARQADGVGCNRPQKTPGDTRQPGKEKVADRKSRPLARAEHLTEMVNQLFCSVVYDVMCRHDFSLSNDSGQLCNGIELLNDFRMDLFLFHYGGNAIEGILRHYVVLAYHPVELLEEGFKDHLACLGVQEKW